jgi:hypothetical protein
MRAAVRVRRPPGSAHGIGTNIDRKLTFVAGHQPPMSQIVVAFNDPDSKSS